MPQSTPSLQRLRFLRAALDRGLLNPDAVFGPRTGDMPTLSEAEWLMRFEVLKAHGYFESGALSDLVREFRLEDTAPADVEVPEAFPEALRDRFEALSRIGEGGMGVVYKAYDRRLERTVALKFLKHLEPETWDRFLREARAQAQLEHPGVGRVFEVVQDAERPYLVLQFIDGPTLGQATPQLDLRERVGLIRQVAEALHACHRGGILHRDLKPGNVLLERLPEGGWKPFLVDFGLARNMGGTTEATMPGLLMGTPAFSSPEALRGGEVDPRSDVYGLGATLYATVTGHAPFEAESTWELIRKVQDADPIPPRRHRPDLPRDLEAVMLKALEKRPEDRYPSAQAFGADLQRYLDADPTEAHSGLGYRLWKRLRKVGPLRLLGGLAATTLLAGGGWGLWTWRQTRVQVGLAQQITLEVDRIELEVSRDLALPLHNVRPVKDRAQAKLEALRRELEGRPAWVQAPARAALGRGHLVLGQLEEARANFEWAWSKGRQQDPETALALGTTLARLYQQALEGLRGKALEDRRKELERDLRQPALAYLRRAPSGSGPMAEALLALVGDHPEEALPHLHAVQAQQGWNPEPWILEAEWLRAQAGAALARGAYGEAEQRSEAALSALAHAESLQRSGPRIHEAIAQARFLQLWIRNDQGQPGEPAFAAARDASDRALATDPANPRAWSLRSALFRQWATQQRRSGGNPTEALVAAEAAAIQGLKLKAEDNELANNLGTLLRWRADWESAHGQDPIPTLDRAIAVLRTALLRPQIRDFLLNNLGNCLASQAQWGLQHGADPTEKVEEAVRCFDEAMALRPWVGHPASAAGALRTLAQHRRWQGRDPRPDLARALAAYGQALALNPNSFLTHGWLADTLLQRAEWFPEQAREDLEAAERHARLAQSLNPRDPLARQCLALHALLAGRLGEVEAYLHHAPKDADAAILGARLALLRKRGEGAALNEIRRLRGLQGWDATLALWEGRLLRALVQPRAADLAFSEACRLNPLLASEVTRP